jgi:uncharacterized protein (DUF1778 family)
MASVETTTIRVRRSTQQRLQKEAELAGKSVTQVLEEAADVLEENRLIDSAVRSWEKLAAMPAEVAALDGSLTDQELSELLLSEAG